jgi:hypothetical protein
VSSAANSTALVGSFRSARGHVGPHACALVSGPRVSKICGIWQIPFKSSAVNPAEAACALVCRGAHEGAVPYYCYIQHCP